ncbi:uncharacterized protein BO80DRAFT_193216 [Aspergillus ibericus CBS 121593]|uniref:Uncharacterized protein n=1 Tax=Aspergillus ibericus CBS 121593 TaxID=1448316 RepID=A0A395GTM3_9EURO|nr:hypothetical protein BO80DRAFT_193216 [Aspergillus ibericus CBS 121593]RAK97443.1 hypothetical protein BO80DRAFT_193216 [Aspergillus ibericus CBS 121593]
MCALRYTRPGMFTHIHGFRVHMQRIIPAGQPWPNPHGVHWSGPKSSPTELVKSFTWALFLNPLHLPSQYHTMFMQAASTPRRGPCIVPTAKIPGGRVWGAACIGGRRKLHVQMALSAGSWSLAFPGTMQCAKHYDWLSFRQGMMHGTQSEAACW